MIKRRGGPPHRRKEGPTTRWKKTGTTGKRAKRASERASASRLPPGRIINFRRTRNPFNILSETLQPVS